MTRSPLLAEEKSERKVRRANFGSERAGAMPASGLPISDSAFASPGKREASGAHWPMRPMTCAASGRRWRLVVM
jgi:hypothetical protein